MPYFFATTLQKKGLKIQTIHNGPREAQILIFGGLLRVLEELESGGLGLRVLGGFGAKLLDYLALLAWPT